MNGRVGRPGKAHIDDARIVRRRPVEAFEDIECRAIGAFVGRIEGTDRQDARARCCAHQSAVGRDQAGDGGAVFMRRKWLSQRVVGLSDRAGEIGVIDVHARVDDGDQYLVALGERMRLRQMQLGEFVLRGVAFLGRRGFALLHREQIIRLHRGHSRVALKSLYCSWH